MNISDIIEEIHGINSRELDQSWGAEYLPVKVILTTDDGVVESGFGDIDSWRGAYNEPCLFLGDNSSSKDLLKELYMVQSGSGYTGYKGGYYSYGASYELNVETDYSMYSGDGYIDSVYYDETRKCIIITCNKTQ